VIVNIIVISKLVIIIINVEDSRLQFPSGMKK